MPLQGQEGGSPCATRADDDGDAGAATAASAREQDDPLLEQRPPHLPASTSSAPAPAPAASTPQSSWYQRIASSVLSQTAQWLPSGAANLFTFKDLVQKLLRKLLDPYLNNVTLTSFTQTTIGLQNVTFKRKVLHQLEPYLLGGIDVLDASEIGEVEVKIPFGWREFFWGGEASHGPNPGPGKYGIVQVRVKNVRLRVRLGGNGDHDAPPTSAEGMNMTTTAASLPSPDPEARGPPAVANTTAAAEEDPLAEVRELVQRLKDNKEAEVVRLEKKLTDLLKLQIAGRETGNAKNAVIAHPHDVAQHEEQHAHQNNTKTTSTSTPPGAPPATSSTSRVGRLLENVVRNLDVEIENVRIEIVCSREQKVGEGRSSSLVDDATRGGLGTVAVAGKPQLELGLAVRHVRMAEPESRQGGTKAPAAAEARAGVSGAGGAEEYVYDPNAAADCHSLFRKELLLRDMSLWLDGASTLAVSSSSRRERDYADVSKGDRERDEDGEDQHDYILRPCGNVSSFLFGMGAGDKKAQRPAGMQIELALGLGDEANRSIWGCDMTHKQWAAFSYMLWRLFDKSVWLQHTWLPQSLYRTLPEDKKLCYEEYKTLYVGEKLLAVDLIKEGGKAGGGEETGAAKQNKQAAVLLASKTTASGSTQAGGGESKQCGAVAGGQTAHQVLGRRATVTSVSGELPSRPSTSTGRPRISNRSDDRHRTSVPDDKGGDQGDDHANNLKMLRDLLQEFEDANDKKTAATQGSTTKTNAKSKKNPPTDYGYDTIWVRENLTAAQLELLRGGRSTTAAQRRRNLRRLEQLTGMLSAKLQAEWRVRIKRELLAKANKSTASTEEMNNFDFDLLWRTEVNPAPWQLFVAVKVSRMAANLWHEERSKTVPLLQLKTLGADFFFGTRGLGGRGISHLGSDAGLYDMELRLRPSSAMMYELPLFSYTGSSGGTSSTSLGDECDQEFVHLLCRQKQESSRRVLHVTSKLKSGVVHLKPGMLDALLRWFDSADMVNEMTQSEYERCLLVKLEEVRRKRAAEAEAAWEADIMKTEKEQKMYEHQYARFSSGRSTPTAAGAAGKPGEPRRDPLAELRRRLGGAVREDLDLLGRRDEMLRSPRAKLLAAATDRDADGFCYHSDDGGSDGGSRGRRRTSSLDSFCSLSSGDQDGGNLTPTSDGGKKNANVTVLARTPPAGGAAHNITEDDVEKVEQEEGSAASNEKSASKLFKSRNYYDALHFARFYGDRLDYVLQNYRPDAYAIDAQLSNTVTHFLSTDGIASISVASMSVFTSDNDPLSLSWMKIKTIAEDYALAIRPDRYVVAYVPEEGGASNSSSSPSSSGGEVAPACCSDFFRLNPGARYLGFLDEKASGEAVEEEKKWRNEMAALWRRQSAKSSDFLELGGKKSCFGQEEGEEMAAPEDDVVVDKSLTDYFENSVLQLESVLAGVHGFQRKRAGGPPKATLSTTTPALAGEAGANRARDEWGRRNKRTRDRSSGAAVSMSPSPGEKDTGSASSVAISSESNEYLVVPPVKIAVFTEMDFCWASLDVNKMAVVVNILQPMRMNLHPKVMPCLMNFGLEISDAFLRQEDGPEEAGTEVVDERNSRRKTTGATSRENLFVDEGSEHARQEMLDLTHFSPPAPLRDASGFGANNGNLCLHERESLEEFVMRKLGPRRALEALELKRKIQGLTQTAPTASLSPSRMRKVEDLEAKLRWLTQCADAELAPRARRVSRGNGFPAIRSPPPDRKLYALHPSEDSGASSPSPSKRASTTRRKLYDVVVAAGSGGIAHRTATDAATSRSGTEEESRQHREQHELLHEMGSAGYNVEGEGGSAPEGGAVHRSTKTAAPAGGAEGEQRGQADGDHHAAFRRASTHSSDNCTRTSVSSTNAPSLSARLRTLLDADRRRFLATREERKKKALNFKFVTVKINERAFIVLQDEERDPVMEIAYRTPFLNVSMFHDPCIGPESNRMKVSARPCSYFDIRMKNRRTRQWEPVLEPTGMTWSYVQSSAGMEVKVKIADLLMWTFSPSLLRQYSWFAPHWYAKYAETCQLHCAAEKEKLARKNCTQVYSAAGTARVKEDNSESANAVDETNVEKVVPHVEHDDDEAAREGPHCSVAVDSSKRQTLGSELQVSAGTSIKAAAGASRNKSNRHGGFRGVNLLSHPCTLLFYADGRKVASFRMPGTTGAPERCHAGGCDDDDEEDSEAEFLAELEEQAGSPIDIEKAGRSEKALPWTFSYPSLSENVPSGTTGSSAAGDHGSFFTEQSTAGTACFPSGAERGTSEMEQRPSSSSSSSTVFRGQVQLTPLGEEKEKLVLDVDGTSGSSASASGVWLPDSGLSCASSTAPGAAAHPRLTRRPGLRRGGVSRRRDRQKQHVGAVIHSLDAFIVPHSAEEVVVQVAGFPPSARMQLYHENFAEVLPRAHAFAQVHMKKLLVAGRVLLHNECSLPFRFCSDEMKEGEMYSIARNFIFRTPNDLALANEVQGRADRTLDEGEVEGRPRHAFPSNHVVSPLVFIPPESGAGEDSAAAAWSFSFHTRLQYHDDVGTQPLALDPADLPYGWTVVLRTPVAPRGLDEAEAQEENTAALNSAPAAAELVNSTATFAGLDATSETETAGTRTRPGLIGAEDGVPAAVGSDGHTLSAERRSPRQAEGHPGPIRTSANSDPVQRLLTHLSSNSQELHRIAAAGPVATDEHTPQAVAQQVTFSSKTEAALFGVRADHGKLHVDGPAGGGQESFFSAGFWSFFLTNEAQQAKKEKQAKKEAKRRREREASAYLDQPLLTEAQLRYFSELGGVGDPAHQDRFAYFAATRGSPAHLHRPGGGQGHPRAHFGAMFAPTTADGRLLPPGVDCSGQTESSLYFGLRTSNATAVFGPAQGADSSTSFGRNGGYSPSRRGSITLGNRTSTTSRLEFPHPRTGGLVHPHESDSAEPPLKQLARNAIFPKKEAAAPAAPQLLAPSDEGGAVAFDSSSPSELSPSPAARISQQFHHRSLAMTADAQHTSRSRTNLLAVGPPPDIATASAGHQPHQKTGAELEAERHRQKLNIGLQAPFEQVFLQPALTFYNSLPATLELKFHVCREPVDALRLMSLYLKSGFFANFSAHKRRKQEEWKSAQQAASNKSTAESVGAGYGTGVKLGAEIVEGVERRTWSWEEKIRLELRRLRVEYFGTEYEELRKLQSAKRDAVRTLILGCIARKRRKERRRKLRLLELAASKQHEIEREADTRKSSHALSQATRRTSATGRIEEEEVHGRLPPDEHLTAMDELAGISSISRILPQTEVESLPMSKTSTFRDDLGGTVAEFGTCINSEADLPSRSQSLVDAYERSLRGRRRSSEGRSLGFTTTLEDPREDDAGSGSGTRPQEEEEEQDETPSFAASTRQQQERRHSGNADECFDDGRAQDDNSEPAQTEYQQSADCKEEELDFDAVDEQVANRVLRKDVDGKDLYLGKTLNEFIRLHKVQERRTTVNPFAVFHCYDLNPNVPVFMKMRAVDGAAGKERNEMNLWSTFEPFLPLPPTDVDMVFDIVKSEVPHPQRGSCHESGLPAEQSLCAPEAGVDVRPAQVAVDLGDMLPAIAENEWQPTVEEGARAVAAMRACHRAYHRLLSRSPHLAAGESRFPLRIEHCSFSASDDSEDADLSDGHGDIDRETTGRISTFAARPDRFPSGLSPAKSLYAGLLAEEERLGRASRTPMAAPSLHGEIDESFAITPPRRTTKATPTSRQNSRPHRRLRRPLHATGGLLILDAAEQKKADAAATRQSQLSALRTLLHQLDALELSSCAPSVSHFYFDADARTGVGSLLGASATARSNSVGSGAAQRGPISACYFTPTHRREWNVLHFESELWLINRVPHSESAAELSFANVPRFSVVGHNSASSKYNTPDIDEETRISSVYLLPVDLQSLWLKATALDRDVEEQTRGASDERAAAPGALPLATQQRPLPPPPPPKRAIETHRLPLGPVFVPGVKEAKIPNLPNVLLQTETLQTYPTAPVTKVLYLAPRLVFTNLDCPGQIDVLFLQAGAQVAAAAETDTLATTPSGSKSSGPPDRKSIRSGESVTSRFAEKNITHIQFRYVPDDALQRLDAVQKDLLASSNSLMWSAPGESKEDVDDEIVAEIARKKQEVYAQATSSIVIAVDGPDLRPGTFPFSVGLHNDLVTVEICPTDPAAAMQRVASSAVVESSKQARQMSTGSAGTSSSFYSSSAIGGGSGVIGVNFRHGSDFLLKNSTSSAICVANKKFAVYPGNEKPYGYHDPFQNPRLVSVVIIAEEKSEPPLLIDVHSSQTVYSVSRRFATICYRKKGKNVLEVKEHFFDVGDEGGTSTAAMARKRGTRRSVRGGAANLLYPLVPAGNAADTAVQGFRLDFAVSEMGVSLLQENNNVQEIFYLQFDMSRIAITQDPSLDTMYFDMAIENMQLDCVLPERKDFRNPAHKMNRANGSAPAAAAAAESTTRGTAAMIENEHCLAENDGRCWFPRETPNAGKENENRAAAGCAGGSTGKNRSCTTTLDGGRSGHNPNRHANSNDKLARRQRRRNGRANTSHFAGSSTTSNQLVRGTVEPYVGRLGQKPLVSSAAFGGFRHDGHDQGEDVPHSASSHAERLLSEDDRCPELENGHRMNSRHSLHYPGEETAPLLGDVNDEDACDLERGLRRRHDENADATDHSANRRGAEGHDAEIALATTSNRRTSKDGSHATSSRKRQLGTHTVVIGCRKFRECFFTLEGYKHGCSGADSLFRNVQFQLDDLEISLDADLLNYLAAWSAQGLEGITAEEELVMLYGESASCVAGTTTSSSSSPSATSAGRSSWHHGLSWKELQVKVGGAGDYHPVNASKVNDATPHRRHLLRHTSNKNRSSCEEDDAYAARLAAPPRTVWCYLRRKARSSYLSDFKIPQVLPVIQWEHLELGRFDVFLWMYLELPKVALLPEYVKSGSWVKVMTDEGVLELSGEVLPLTSQKTQYYRGDWYSWAVNETAFHWAVDAWTTILPLVAGKVKGLSLIPAGWRRLLAVVQRVGVWIAWGCGLMGEFLATFTFDPEYIAHKAALRRDLKISTLTGGLMEAYREGCELLGCLFDFLTLPIEAVGMTRKAKMGGLEEDGCSDDESTSCSNEGEPTPSSCRSSSSSAGSPGSSRSSATSRSSSRTGSCRSSVASESAATRTSTSTSGSSEEISLLDPDAVSCHAMPPPPLGLGQATEATVAVVPRHASIAVNAEDDHHDTQVLRGRHDDLARSAADGGGEVAVAVPESREIDDERPDDAVGSHIKLVDTPLNAASLLPALGWGLLGTTFKTLDHFMYMGENTVTGLTSTLTGSANLWLTRKGENVLRKVNTRVRLPRFLPAGSGVAAGAASGGGRTFASTSACTGGGAASSFLSTWEAVIKNYLGAAVLSGAEAIVPVSVTTLSCQSPTDTRRSAPHQTQTRKSSHGVPRLPSAEVEDLRHQEKMLSCEEPPPEESNSGMRGSCSPAADQTNCSFASLDSREMNLDEEEAGACGDGVGDGPADSKFRSRGRPSTSSSGASSSSSDSPSPTSAGEAASEEDNFLHLSADGYVQIQIGVIVLFARKMQFVEVPWAIPLAELREFIAAQQRSHTVSTSESVLMKHQRPSPHQDPHDEQQQDAAGTSRVSEAEIAEQDRSSSEEVALPPAVRATTSAPAVGAVIDGAPAEVEARTQGRATEPATEEQRHRRHHHDRTTGHRQGSRGAPPPPAPQAGKTPASVSHKATTASDVKHPFLVRKMGPLSELSKKREPVKERPMAQQFLRSLLDLTEEEETRLTGVGTTEAEEHGRRQRSYVEQQKQTAVSGGWGACSEAVGAAGAAAPVLGAAADPRQEIACRGPGNANYPTTSTPRAAEAEDERPRSEIFPRAFDPDSERSAVATAGQQQQGGLAAIDEERTSGRENATKQQLTFLDYVVQWMFHSPRVFPQTSVDEKCRSSRSSCTPRRRRASRRRSERAKAGDGAAARDSRERSRGGLHHANPRSSSPNSLLPLPLSAEPKKASVASTAVVHGSRTQIKSHELPRHSASFAGEQTMRKVRKIDSSERVVLEKYGMDLHERTEKNPSSGDLDCHVWAAASNSSSYRVINTSGAAAVASRPPPLQATAHLIQGPREYLTIKYGCLPRSFLLPGFRVEKQTEDDEDDANLFSDSERGTREHEEDLLAEIRRANRILWKNPDMRVGDVPWSDRCTTAGTAPLAAAHTPQVQPHSNNGDASLGDDLSRSRTSDVGRRLRTFSFSRSRRSRRRSATDRESEQALKGRQPGAVADRIEVLRERIAELDRISPCSVMPGLFSPPIADAAGGVAACSGNNATQPEERDIMKVAFEIEGMYVEKVEVVSSATTTTDHHGGKKQEVAPGAARAHLHLPPWSVESTRVLRITLSDATYLKRRKARLLAASAPRRDKLKNSFTKSTAGGSRTAGVGRASKETTSTMKGQLLLKPNTTRKSNSSGNLSQMLKSLSPSERRLIDREPVSSVVEIPMHTGVCPEAVAFALAACLEAGTGRVQPQIANPEQNREANNSDSVSTTDSAVSSSTVSATSRLVLSSVSGAESRVKRNPFLLLRFLLDEEVRKSRERMGSMSVFNTALHNGSTASAEQFDDQLQHDQLSITKTITVYELERTTLTSFTSPFLPCDTKEQWRWVDVNGNKHPNISKYLTRREVQDARMPPLDFGKLWIAKTEWKVVVLAPEHETDEEGWQYSTHFGSNLWTAHDHWHHVVRRRKWVREYV